MQNKRWLLVSVLLVLMATGTVAAHDLFLKLDSYFVSPGASLVVRVLNGSFNQSEAAVSRDRVRDLTLVTPTGMVRLDTAAWTTQGDTSTLTVKTEESGTYVLGASLRSREIELSAKDFNEYLAHDGIPDVLAARRRANQLDRPARERYSKHVKALVQVGDTRSDEYRTGLEYPAELIPLNNPYTLRAGGWFRIRAIVDGRPIADQLIVAGGPGTKVSSTRTDSRGEARVRIGTGGAWYVKFIHMRPAQGDTTIDYESKWATLTFGVR